MCGAKVQGRTEPDEVRRQVYNIGFNVPSKVKRSFYNVVLEAA